MTRLRQRDLRFKGEITAFVSLIFILVVSLTGALLASAQVQVKKSSMRAKMQIALESVFAEYDKELLEQYDVFARLEAEGLGVTERLYYYGIVDCDQEVTKSEFLTDSEGLPFYQAAVRYMKNWLGDDSEMGSFSGEEFETDDSLEELEEETQESLDELLSQDEESLVEEGNPLDMVQSLKSAKLLSILVANADDLSHRSIELSGLPSNRELNEGTGRFEESEGEGNLADKAMFVEYLFEHFNDASEERNLNALSYELEYILCGKSVDSENLEGVLQKILLIRMGINYAYLLTDSEKQAEAAALAATLCALLTVPGITGAVQQALLLAWAYGESIIDLRVLMKQDRVPLLKTSATWQLQLSNLSKLGTREEVSDEKSVEDGLHYCDYLKGLLLLESREKLSMRALDLIECNLSVQVDQCLTKVEVESEHTLRRGVKDRFETIFYYQ